MIFGIIYDKYAIIELDKDKFIFYKNWQKELDSKEVSKKCVISSFNFFCKKLNTLKTDWRNTYLINKIIKKQQLNYSLDFYPKVSIILSAFNAEKTLKRSIKSILKQSYPNIELIMIDDCSQDNTFEVMQAYKEKAKIIRNKENRGVYYNRNQALKIATGKIIGIQDADDISDLQRISKSVSHLIKNNLDFVLTNAKKIDNILEDTSRICVAMATFLCDKDFFDKYGVFDEDTRHSGDLEICDRAYFKKFREYKFKNFWYWLNYTAIEPNFYGHIYETLYYIGTEGDRITKNNKIQKRQKYLNGRRKFFINKNNEQKNLSKNVKE